MSRVNQGGAPPAGSAPIVAEELRVRGVVQGVGFRPFVYAHATRHRLRGWVRNTSAGVEIHVEGPQPDVAAFGDSLPAAAPARAYIAEYDRVPGEVTGAPSFTILESQADPSAYQLVSPDIALCDDCRRELLDPHDRRFHYPFTNCTNCGPRFTIIESLPYDRERTTMRAFALCDDCRREYTDPGDRRFHAEPNACPACGPRVTLLPSGTEPGEAAGASVGSGGAAGGATQAGAAVQASVAAPDLPITCAAELLRAGAILAIKGLGGFHLACDATDGAAVRELKRRKGRPHKPLAVMLADLDHVREHCDLSREEADLLQSPECPIVLLRWHELGAASPIDPEVAVAQRYLGVMLPYTPLHLLLLQSAARPLVMTSGNLAEEPIVKEWAEVGRLAHIADWYLVHDRDIFARYDDSVCHVRRGRPRLVRRSRGYAPFPVTLPRRLPQVLACGAELKNTFCFTRDANAFLSQHIGDLENIETLEHFESSVELYKRLFGLQPEVVACDLHPEYLATKYAQAQPEEKLAVQHHHAHVAACMVENGRTESVIGVSMDGLGYGDDGKLWGGEVLVCDLLGYRRAAHLEYLPLPGGALAIQRPARTAAGWLLALLGEEGLRRGATLMRAYGERDREGGWIGEEELEAVAQQVRAGLNAPLTSSAGRLFDAVAALAGVRGAITYEGQAAIELEMVSGAHGRPYPFVIEGGDDRAPAQVRLAPLFAALLDDLEAGREPGFVGSRLHATLAAIVRDACLLVRDATRLQTVALSGGVFQNRLFSELCEHELEKAGLTVLTHALVPCNDGGLSLGQAVVAGYTLLRQRDLLD